MNIVPDRKSTVHDWPEWTNTEVWMLGPEHSDDDERWAAEHLNEDWHDLDGHPVIDDETIADEGRYWADEARRYATDPTDEEIADLDERAEEAEFIDAHERGLTFF